MKNPPEEFEMQKFRISDRTLQYIIIITIVSVLSGIIALSGSVLAHEGHAGKLVVFLKKEEALKQILPGGAKVVQRKEMLDRGKAEKAKKEFGVKLDDGVYTYYIARDKTSGATTGAAIVTEVAYMHGEVNLAIGIDTKGNVTKAAILSVNEKYLQDLKSSVGTGYLRQVEGVSIKKLVSMANEASGSAKVTETIYSQMRDMAVLLSISLTSSQ